MSSRDTKTYTVPDGFPELLKDFAREVLRGQPKNIYQFGAEYFNRKLQERQQQAEQDSQQQQSYDASNLPSFETHLENVHRLNLEQLGNDIRDPIVAEQEDYKADSEELPITDSEVQHQPEMEAADDGVDEDPETLKEPLNAEGGETSGEVVETETHEEHDWIRDEYGENTPAKSDSTDISKQRGASKGAAAAEEEGELAEYEYKENTMAEDNSAKTTEHHDTPEEAAAAD